MVGRKSKNSKEFWKGSFLNYYGKVRTLRVNLPNACFTTAGPFWMVS